MGIDNLNIDQKNSLLNYIRQFEIESGKFNTSTGLGTETIKMGSNRRIVSGTEEEMLHQKLEFVQQILGKTSVDIYVDSLCKSSILWIDEAKRRLKEDIEKQEKLLNKLQ